MSTFVWKNKSNSKEVNRAGTGIPPRFFPFEEVDRVMWDIISLFLYAVHTNCSLTCTSYFYKGVMEKTKHTWR